MPIPDLIRDSFVGQVIYYGSGRRLFRYPEEKPGFILPPRYAAVAQSHHRQDPTRSALSSRSSHSGTVLDDGKTSKTTAYIDEPSLRPPEKSLDKSSQSESGTPPQHEQFSHEGEATEIKRPLHMPRTESTVAREMLHPHEHKAEHAELGEIEAEKAKQNPYIVDWYGPDDPESPQNVSSDSLSSHFHTLSPARSGRS